MNITGSGTTHCSQCGKEQPHKLVYVGDPEKGEIFLKKVVCEKCGENVEMDRLKILKSYSKWLGLRIFSKPSQVLEELQEHPRILLKSWPKRVLTKPYRMAREFFEIIEE